MLDRLEWRQRAFVIKSRTQNTTSTATRSSRNTAYDRAQYVVETALSER